ncbi:hypothetical protein ACQPYE_08025 [Actinosynnema sp. CA-299493]
MTRTQGDHDRNQERSPENIAMLGDALLDDFREADEKLRQAETTSRRSATPVDEAIEEHHDQFMGLLAELPSRDIELALYVFEKLTDSDAPEDRYWAATFFPHVLRADKRMGLSILTRLISREETEHAVMDKAWEELSTVAYSDDLKFSEAIQYIDTYHGLLRERYRTRAERARGKRRDDHTRYDSFPPYSFPTPGDAAAQSAEQVGDDERHDT